jgi:cell filamentation protein
MSFEAYDAFDDPYAYPHSLVLKNRLNIADAKTLQSFEVEMSTLRAAEPFPAGDLNAEHYRSVHRHLFGDVYEWAGEYRTVRTSKGGNAFCYPEYTADQVDRIFHELPAAEELRALKTDAFVRILAAFLGEMNAVHPFRDGNGRTQLVFLRAIAADAGRPLALDRLQRDTYLPAIIASFTGQLICSSRH